MGQDNPVPRRINRVEGALGQLIQCQGPGVVEKWANPSDIGVDYGMSFRGTVTGIAGAPAFNCEGLIGFGDNFFKDYWAYVVWNQDTPGAAPQGEMLECTGYTSATGLFTVAAYTVGIAVDDVVLFLHPSIASLVNTTYGLSALKADTQIRRVASGTSGVIGTGVTKYIEIDSLTNGAEILAVIINGVVTGFDWTLSVYVPTADLVAAPAAGDKRDEITYVAADTEGGLLKPFAIAYNAFLQFTNDNVGDQTITDVVVVYRSRGVITIGAWT